MLVVTQDGRALWFTVKEADDWPDAGGVYGTDDPPSPDAWPDFARLLRECSTSNRPH